MTSIICHWETEHGLEITKRNKQHQQKVKKTLVLYIQSSRVARNVGAYIKTNRECVFSGNELPQEKSWNFQKRQV